MQHPLRVLLSAYACLPNAGTEPGNGWNWAVNLANRGISIHVLTVQEGRAAIEEYCAVHPIPNLSFTYISMPLFLRHTTPLHYAWWQWAAVPHARELHSTDPFDLVHHVTYSSIHVPTQLWKLKIPTVFGPVGGGQVTERSMLREFGSSWRTEVVRTAFTLFLPYSPFHRRWLNKMALVLATNQDTLTLARRLTKKPVRFRFDAALPVSFCLEKPRTFLRTETPLRILWVGRMVPRKALPLALQIVSRAQRPVMLTIVGDGLPHQEVLEMIRFLGLTDRVHWAGRRLDREEVRAAYLGHDVLLFSSLRDSCPAQLLEAMGLGLPVITLDHHGAHDLVPDGAGIKVPITSPNRTVEEMAGALDRFADLGYLEREAMSRIGWEFARTLNYNAGAAQFEAIYRELLNFPFIDHAEPADSRLPERGTLHNSRPIDAILQR